MAEPSRECEEVETNGSLRRTTDERMKRGRKEPRELATPAAWWQSRPANVKRWKPTDSCAGQRMMCLYFDRYFKEGGE